jgi:mono/diheme cytochrome c family protein
MNLIPRDHPLSRRQEPKGNAAAIRASAPIGSLAILAAALAGIGIGLLGCGGGSWNVPPAAKAVKNPVSPTPQTLADARRIYLDRCAHCHGVNGDGKRPPGTMYLYWVQPTKFTDAKIMDAMTDGEIFWKITTGNRPMPSYKNRLSVEERWELVNFLRAFAQLPKPPVPSHQNPSP